MSASQEKKTRKQLREEGQDPRITAEMKAEKKAKHSKRVRIIVGILIVLFIVAVFTINSNLLYNNFSAVTVGDVSYTASELSFFYKSIYMNTMQSGSSYMSYIIDVNKPLSSQPYSEDMSWADYFRETAITEMTNMTMRWAEAQKAGYVLDEEQQARLDEQLATVDTAYLTTASGYPNANAFYAANYGKGLDTERVKKLIEISFVSSEYAQSVADSFNFTDSELEKEYKEEADGYDVYNFMSYFASGAADEENNIDAETAMASAKELADSLISDKAAQPDTDTDADADTDTDADADADTDADADADSDENDIATESDETPDAADFGKKVLALTGEEATVSSTRGSSLSASYADWLKDPARKAGDKTVIETDNGYYALYYTSRSDNDYDAVDVRHILVRATASEDGTYTDEAKKAAKTTADELLKKWKDGDATEDSFAALANEKSTDGGSNTNGGLYENVLKDQMVEEFNDWIFDAGRKAGDTGIVFNESGSYCGYHVMYFTGKGDNARNVLAEATLRNEAFEAWQTEKLEGYTATKGFTAGLVK